MWTRLIGFAGLWLGTGAVACTTFLLPQSTNHVVGKSFDWHQGQGVVLTNQRHLAKRALSLTPGEKAASWTSRFGSLTFNQAGREFPLGGINEKGLAVEIMWLDSSVYPGNDGLPALNELQWIQYLLDGAENVSEAVALAKTVRVNRVFAKVHYLACDATGACATFEYIDGRLVIHQGADLPVTALTNDPYADSMASLAKYVGFGGTVPLPTGVASLDRFARAATRVKDYAGGDAVAYAFSTLDAVSAGDYTKWNIVYETGTGQAHWRTLESRDIKTVGLAQFDFACQSPVKMVDINRGTAGNTALGFVNYSRAANERLLRAAMTQVKTIPSFLIPTIAAYPESAHCLE